MKTITFSALLLHFLAGCHANTCLRWSPAEDAKCWGLETPRRSFLSARPRGQLRDSLLQGDTEWNPTTPADLAEQYDEIFAPSGNRNAASHLWAEFILSRSNSLSHDQIEKAFTWFCPVSGSPLGDPSPRTRYKSTLALAGGEGEVTGITNHCCLPCICDVTAVIKVDTKTITDSSGTSQEYHFTVIGDPCANKPPTCTKAGEHNCLPFEAPAVKCNDGQLEKAILSDHGYVIIGMFSSADNLAAGEYIDYETMTDDEGNTLKGFCQERADAGYDSGMGAIFQQVARLNPI
eukprot:gb/GFBE01021381.1/.p1 GENE.gb/GFBE01021381.1/~~gb/GFBE01021381.1/.p1  ORF type:complete len:291 (+),score=54.95 gb/GFBE01021381.1/:1-873(+)